MDNVYWGGGGGSAENFTIFYIFGMFVTRVCFARVRTCEIDKQWDLPVVVVKREENCMLCVNNEYLCNYLHYNIK